MKNKKKSTIEDEKKEGNDLVICVSCTCHPSTYDIPPSRSNASRLFKNAPPPSSSTTLPWHHAHLKYDVDEVAQF